MTQQMHRRTFLGQGLAVSAGLWLSGSTQVARSRSANDKLNLGIIGCGGRGGHNLGQMSGENIVALADVNEKNLGAAAGRYPKARKYVDFRKLLDASNDLDAVVVSTTEHTHAFATLPALQLDKHVYCEKPLAHSVEEVRKVTQECAKRKLATQMGTQIHATDNYRRVVELVQGGAIGPVRECHVWVSRGWGGGDRPTKAETPPAYLDWDLWLGPAPKRPYNSEYFPGPKWYKWWDFGGGVLPDLGSHWNDLPFWALNLTAPQTIEAEGPQVHPETAPPWMIVHWQFPSRGELPPCKLSWYQGGKKPSLVAEGKVPGWGSGALFVGSKGMLLADYRKHVLLPEKEFADFTRPTASIPPSIGHHAEWIRACKEGTPTTCPFTYSGPLTESNILGIVAYRTGQKLEWDAKNLRAANCPEAEKYLRKTYRAGWSL